MKTHALSARLRTETGSRACHRLRRGGEIPASFYAAYKSEEGTKLESIKLAVSAYEMTQLIERNHGLLALSFDGRDEIAQISEVQRDQLGDSVLHVDLHWIDTNKPITATVPLLFRGEPKGAKVGGVFKTFLKTIVLTGLIKDMPSEVVVKTDDFDLGFSMHVDTLPLPEGVSAVTESRQAVCLIETPEEEDEEEAEE